MKRKQKTVPVGKTLVEVFFPASCKLPPKGYVGELERCAEVDGGLRCWHFGGHDGAHQDEQWAESGGKKGRQWR